ncbi:hypothetical protein C8J57DRAFT_1222756 [Mycena rebaudengoi]|nr:hypothetical protein C8J57DRAFT_1222756 [Mycena rebaudengoi]
MEGVVGIEIGSVSLVTEGVVEFTQQFVMFKCVQNAQKSAMLAVFKVNVSKFWRVSHEISWGVESRGFENAKIRTHLTIFFSEGSRTPPSLRHRPPAIKFPFWDTSIQLQDNYRRRLGPQDWQTQDFYPPLNSDMLLTCSSEACRSTQRKFLDSRVTDQNQIVTNLFAEAAKLGNLSTSRAPSFCMQTQTSRRPSCAYGSRPPTLSGLDPQLADETVSPPSTWPIASPHVVPQDETIKTRRSLKTHGVKSQSLCAAEFVVVRKRRSWITAFDIAPPGCFRERECRVGPRWTGADGEVRTGSKAASVLGHLRSLGGPSFRLLSAEEPLPIADTNCIYRLSKPDPIPESTHAPHYWASHFCLPSADEQFQGPLVLELRRRNPGIGLWKSEDSMNKNTDACAVSYGYWFRLLKLAYLYNHCHRVAEEPYHQLLVVHTLQAKPTLLSWVMLSSDAGSRHEQEPQQAFEICLAQAPSQ